MRDEYTYGWLIVIFALDVLVGGSDRSECDLASMYLVAAPEEGPSPTNAPKVSLRFELVRPYSEVVIDNNDTFRAGKEKSGFQA